MSEFWINIAISGPVTVAKVGRVGGPTVTIPPPEVPQLLADLAQVEAGPAARARYTGLVLQEWFNRHHKPALRVAS